MLNIKVFKLPGFFNTSVITNSMIKISKVKLKDLNLNWVNWLNDPDVVKYSIQRKRKHSYNSQKNFLKKNLILNLQYYLKLFTKKNLWE